MDQNFHVPQIVPQDGDPGLLPWDELPIPPERSSSPMTFGWASDLREDNLGSVSDLDQALLSIDYALDDPILGNTTVQVEQVLGEQSDDLDHISITSPYFDMQKDTENLTDMAGVVFGILSHDTDNYEEVKQLHTQRREEQEKMVRPPIITTLFPPSYTSKAIHPNEQANSRWAPREPQNKQELQGPLTEHQQLRIRTSPARSYQEIMTDMGAVLLLETSTRSCSQGLNGQPISNMPTEPCARKTSYARLPLAAVAILDDWFAAHRENPYPSEEEKQELIRKSALSKKQVNTWLMNARRRQLDPMAVWLSGGSDNEGASEKDIRRAAEGIIEGQSPFYGQKSSSDAFCTSADSASSCSSAFSHCPEARWTGPRRRGRRSYGTPAHSRSASLSSASMASDSGEHYLRTLPRSPGSIDESSTESITRQFTLKASSLAQKKHKCTICDRGFSRPSILQSHVRIDHGDLQLFECEAEGCKRSFLSEPLLRRHSKAHERQRLRSLVANPAPGESTSISTALTESIQYTVKPATREKKQSHKFQCTFCHKELTEKSWKRHEESQHLPGRLWTCMPENKWTITLIGAFMGVCAFCESEDVDDNHRETCSHRVADCLQRPLEDRIFSRKDHLIQHATQFHHAKLADVTVNSWCSAQMDQSRLWPCGFGTETLVGFNARATHIAAHFRQGLDMSSWETSCEEPIVEAEKQFLEHEFMTQVP